MHDGCVFCKIVRGEIPNYTVYEDEQVLAFLDIFPAAKGHTVVIPKVHASRLFDLNEKGYSALMHGVRITAEKIETVLSPGGLNIGINDGAAAGQSVSHVHMHIIPRYEGDVGGSMHSIVKQPGDESVEDLYARFWHRPTAK